MGQKISIIIPVYNAASHLSQCLDSIVNQTHRNLEIICVNDESTDSSLDILKEYKGRDGRIAIINKKNEGVSIARNAALDIATGQFVLFVDADDWVDLDTCEKALEQIQDADVLMWSYMREYGDTSAPKVIYEGKQVFERERVLQKLHRRMIGAVDEELSHPENADALCTVWGKMYRRDIIKDLRFVDIRKIGTYEDGLFNLRVFEKAKKAIYVNEYYYHYRKNNEISITTAYKPKQTEQFHELFQLMQYYITEGQWGNIYQKALNNRIALSVLGLTLNIISSDKSINEKLKAEKALISHPMYRAAFREFSLSNLPLHWKLFYGGAKMNCAFSVYFIGKGVYRILHERR